MPHLEINIPGSLAFVHPHYRYALDHFQTKLLKLPQTMQTVRGKQLAQHNAHFLVEFMAKLSAELAGENEGVDHKVIDAFSPAG